MTEKEIIEELEKFMNSISDGMDYRNVIEQHQFPYVAKALIKKGGK